MKNNVKTTIHLNGQESSSPGELPPKMRAVYRKAALAGCSSLNRCLDKIILHRPGSYDDILSVVENNGHVTLPQFSEPFFTRHRIKVGVALLGASLAVALALVKTVG